MKNKQLLYIFLTTLFTLTFFSKNLNSQTVDEIVERHIKAMGGKEKLDSLNTVVIEGTFRLENFELPLKAYLANNTGQRYDVMVMKVPGFIIATPKEGWQYFPFQGMKEPKRITNEELNIYLPYMDLQCSLYNYKQKGSTLEYMGLQEINEAICHKFSVHLKSGKKMITYVDTISNYIIKTDSEISNNGKDTLLENLYANFQKTKNGFIFPFALTLGPGKAFVSKIYVNIPIDPLLFNPFESKKTGF
ncbi:MAG: hypothetical protein ABIU11_06925 [Chitinophagaceae bacterium]